MALRRLVTLQSHLLPSRSLAITAPLATRPLTAFKLGSAFSTAPPADMSEIKQLVDSTIAENNVVVFSKTYCPYCKKAKTILQNITDDVKVLELDNLDEGSTIQAYLKQLNGQGTVPHVYIRQEFIGGCSDLQQIPADKLKKMIAGTA
ncbi:thioredoxin-like protein [Papiliotrema laurentii]|uniref:Thioredoxin-like protein n=1 Tax=Papiliotrema laurentii TaxID=5418 RepID=A0AAD9L8N2_PAPLA|nr:thioredoxin-like protein [Papiliotrema laurentii]